jgi:5S rRNA maturation endonuclease (ribonuclease M5)
VRLLRKKNQAFDAFKTFQTNIERFNDAKIIILRIDNEGEYIDKKFQNYLTENEIN